MDFKSFLDKKNVIAIVGASDNRDKYGNIIFRDLRDAGYKVIPVNPNADIVEGEKCYHSLSEIPIKIDVVDTVVPPHITEQIVKECKKIGITKVWMQPGSESEEAIIFCKDNGIEVIYENCIMAQRRFLEAEQSRKSN
ncbi:MAG: CoA-binding protein [Candidatus Methanofastidiosum sp.]|nr:CoA-binding protein [Methanofastidiosum sp.]NYT04594.1 CoA-binding protein [Candidatus Methanofastidiosa archaeon]